jgi:uncharacterized phiE125 gp8 family phage protein
MARFTTLLGENISTIITLAEAKIHLRVGDSGDDAYITSLIFAAQDAINNYCNINLMSRSIIQTCDTWEDTEILLISPPANSGAVTLTSVQYYNLANILTTDTLTNYILDSASTPPRLELRQDKTYPKTYERNGAIRVTYLCGQLQTSRIPFALKQAALIFVGQFYENRQIDVVGRTVGTIPTAAKFLMEPYRIQTLGC